VSVAAATTVAVAAAPRHSGVAIWPAYAFGVISVGGLYLLLSPLLRWWPFAGPASVGDLLDQQIRAGRDARERIIYGRLDSMAEASEAAAWTLATANLLHVNCPAIADNFLFAAGDQRSFSGQALLVQTVNAKLAVLTAARTGLAS
jgi:hypothetical protein